MAQEAIRALQREKRDVQRQIVQIRRTILQDQRQTGVIDGYAAVRENMALLKLELELAETSAEQRAILEKMVPAARDAEEILRQQRANGTAPSSYAADILQAKAERLDIQIQLEEARLKK